MPKIMCLWAAVSKSFRREEQSTCGPDKNWDCGQACTFLLPLLKSGLGEQ
jgi:hypothetical protein